MDPCKNVKCGPHSKCVGGVCKCDPGYTAEGSACIGMYGISLNHFQLYEHETFSCLIRQP